MKGLLRKSKRIVHIFIKFDVHNWRAKYDPRDACFPYFKLDFTSELLDVTNIKIVKQKRNISSMQSSIFNACLSFS